MRLFYGKTDESVIITVDMQKYKTQIISTVKKNVQKEEILAYSSAQEQLTELYMKTIKDLLKNGFTETKPQEDYPLGFDEEYTIISLKKCFKKDNEFILIVVDTDQLTTKEDIFEENGQVSSEVFQSLDEQGNHYDKKLKTLANSGFIEIQLMEKYIERAKELLNSGFAKIEQDKEAEQDSAKVYLKCLKKQDEFIIFIVDKEQFTTKEDSFEENGTSSCQGFYSLGEQAVQYQERVKELLDSGFVETELPKRYSYRMDELLDSGFTKIGTNEEVKQNPTKIYFRRTNESVQIKVNTTKLKTTIRYGTEASAGNENTKTDKTSCLFPSIIEQSADLRKTVEKLLYLGYVETKPQEKFPNTIDDFYDEAVIKDFKKSEKTALVEHFSLIAWDEIAEESPDDILKYFIENKDKYQHIKHFTFGNMTYEVCEMSWIIQSDYRDFFKAFPLIKSFSVQGSNGLILGKMDLPELEILEIVGSGLDTEMLNHIRESNLPNLKKLNLFFGTDEYGCNVTDVEIKEFLANTNFTNLINLGLCNIENDYFSDILKVIIESKYASQIKVLDISKSVSRDKHAEYLLENIDKLTNIKYIDLEYNFFSQEIREKLEKSPIEINCKDHQEIEKGDDDDDDDWCSPMYTE